MNITRALSDDKRVRMLMALRGGELCVCQITELFGLAPSTISKHLSILFQARLVESRKDERWVYYRLPGAGASSIVKSAITWVVGAIGKEPAIAADAKQLKKILKMDPTELCKGQCSK
ncbi:MAG TPA: metalloregulator ArsR/SmtB family transcription factor [Candidatus Acidoferrales bacterium]|nr:metalloregulator ArsR/SmtB family transcription factor [Candidatus Acidoferrales bacterium]